MKTIIILSALISTAAFAQQGAPGPDVQANVVLALQAQRNNALDQAAVFSAQLQAANKEMDALKAADAKLKADLAAAEAKAPKESK